MNICEPKEYEKHWGEFWESQGFFHAEVDSKKTPYTILIPPPNVTAQLHMGHGLNNTLQDILIRWKRMNGFNACWLPGTDHAGISTQMMVEKHLLRQGIKKEDLGREGFFKACTQWKEEYGSKIIHQLKRLGASCDWQRLAYTMDDNLSLAVRNIFVDLFNKGLIYQKKRLVHWDPVLKTALSDDEVLSQEQNGNLYHIRYDLEEQGEALVVATTRPETLFGDTAVAVHPEDPRYKKWIGKKVKLPLTERWIPVIGDDYVKQDYGTGCLKITPAHDPNDFEVGQRHDLPVISIFHDDGTLSDLCPEPYKGMDRFEARTLVVKDLKAQGRMEKVQPMRHAVPVSDRSGAVIEPKLSLQWYVKMEELAKPALAAAQDGSLEFFPQAWKKTYLHWLEHIQDWCISRQLWWGHRIPIWHCQDCEAHTCTMEDPVVCQHCQSPKIVQDPDVLDTWFSSWLWPLSPFGWPKKTPELDYFFPSQVLITGGDIIFLWVARMIMASYHAKGVLPFQHVYFNPIICDKKGQKFSKTLGNGIDPLEMIDLYGADAVRYTCVSLAPLNGRVRMEPGDFEAGHRLIHKIWNAGRFLLGALGSTQTLDDFDVKDLNLPSVWLVQRFWNTSHNIHKALESYRFQDAMDSLYQFFWRDFCDWGLECSKDILSGADTKEKQDTLSSLFFVFEGWLRLASPFLPFMTEELWHKMPSHPKWPREKSLVISAYPKAQNEQIEEPSWSTIQELISGIRSLRMTSLRPLKEKIIPKVVLSDKELLVALKKVLPLVMKLTSSESIDLFDVLEHQEGCLAATGKGWTAYLSFGPYLDVEKEKQKLTQEIQRISGILTVLENKIKNPDFVARAPEEVVLQTKEQIQNMTSQKEVLSSALASFSSGTGLS